MNQALPQVITVANDRSCRDSAAGRVRAAGRKSQEYRKDALIAMVASSAGMPRAAIVGGGIGGVAAAAFLRRAGLPTVVYEQAPALSEVGAGLVLAPNAVRILRRLGVMDQLAGRAVPLEVGWEFRRWADGQVLSAEDLAGSCERLFGERTYTVHRADLLAAIASAVPAGTVQLGRRCAGVTVRGESAVLAFTDGTLAEADVVIGADGVHSAVRGAVTDPSPPRYSGICAFRSEEHASELQSRPHLVCRLLLEKKKKKHKPEDAKKKKTYKYYEELN